MVTPSPLKVACVLLVCCMVLSTHQAEAAGGLCGKVMMSLSPCILYVKGSSFLPISCCEGVKRIYGGAKTTPARQAVCSCVMAIATRIGGVNDTLVNSLKTKCKVDIPYTYTAALNCTSIK